MAKTNRFCHTCGIGYYYCPSCPDDKRNPQIYVMWCSERCKKIFGILSDETLKKITTAECKSKLIELGVTMNDNFKDGVKVHAERVLNYAEHIEENKEELNSIKDVYNAFAGEIQVVEPIMKSTDVTETNVEHHVSKKKRKNSEVD